MLSKQTILSTRTSYENMKEQIERTNGIIQKQISTGEMNDKTREEVIKLLQEYLESNETLKTMCGLLVDVVESLQDVIDKKESI
jgi:methylthioribose-1-phosphate isomerase